MKFHIAQDAGKLSHDLAEWIIADIQKTLQTKQRYTLVLSGGSTPKRLYELLAKPPYSVQIDWSRIHIFFGDERYVPFEDDRNNGKMAYETLLKYVPVPQDQIHYMHTSLPPEQSAQEYEKILHDYFGTSSHTFDLVLLGMGDDGHTLSLFPGTKIVREKKDWVQAYFVDKLDMFRITLTAPVVNRSRHVVFLATGENKAETLKQVVEGDYNPDRYPSQVIEPADGGLTWFIDKPAAGALENK